MAVLRGRTVLLLVLAGIFSASQISPTRWGQKHFFPLDEFEKNGCIPKGFELKLPESLWVRAMTCRRQFAIDIPVRPDPRAPDADILTQQQRRALYLHCLAQRMNFIGDAGFNKDNLNAFIETLPAPAPFINSLKKHVDICEEGVKAALNTDRYAVFLLSCLRNRFILECSQRIGMSCRTPDLFLRYKFSVSSSELDSPVLWRRCAREVASKGYSVFTNSGNAYSDLCPAMMERAVAIGVCALRETQHTDGKFLIKPALKRSLHQGSGPEALNITGIQELLFGHCARNDRAEHFVRCWIVLSQELSAKRMAYELAMELPQPLPKLLYQTV